jgi:hypothetical protein
LVPDSFSSLSLPSISSLLIIAILLIM